MATRRGKRLLQSEPKRLAIKKYLEEQAPLERFWMAHGLVHFLSVDGQAMVLMDDDDERVEASIAYLESIGAPVLADESAVNCHLAKLREGTFP